MNIELNIDSSRARTDEERRNVEVVGRYFEAYNNLVPDETARFAKTFYHPDCRVWFTGGGYEAGSGHDKLVPLMRAVAEIVPGRRASVQHVHPCHEVVVVEGTHHDLAHPEFSSKWSTALTFDDGLIVEERSHVDPTGFPGLEEAVEVTR